MHINDKGRILWSSYQQRKSSWHPSSKLQDIYQNNGFQFPWRAPGGGGGEGVHNGTSTQATIKVSKL